MYKRQNNKYTGTVLYNQKDITSYTEIEWTSLRRQSISIVFQGLRLFPELTTLENIQLKNQLTNYKTETEILSYLKRLDVDNLAHKKAETLSYGQQQRIAIVRALCQPFELLLLDEPFSHIDTLQIKNATQLILEEITKRNATLMIASLGNTYDIDSVSYTHLTLPTTPYV